MIQAWFDGVCEPKNPGGHAAWGALVKVDSQVVFRKGGYCGNGPLYSNNVAEYAGFLAAAQEAARHTGCIEIRGDSKLVVMQLAGKWRVNGGLYYPYYQLALRTWSSIRDRTRLIWVPRDENGECDDLSKNVLRKLGIKFRIQPEEGGKG